MKRSIRKPMQPSKREHLRTGCSLIRRDTLSIGHSSEGVDYDITFIYLESALSTADEARF